MDLKYFTALHRGAHVFVERNELPPKLSFVVARVFVGLDIPIELLYQALDLSRRGRHSWKGNAPFLFFHRMRKYRIRSKPCQSARRLVAGGATHRYRLFNLSSVVRLTLLYIYRSP